MAHPADNLRPRLATSLLASAATIPAVTVPMIEAKIAAELAGVATLEGEYNVASLELIIGADGAINRVAGIEKEIADAGLRIKQLRGALIAAQERDAAFARRSIAERQKSQLAAVRSHLAARDHAADDISEALGKAVAAWKILSGRSGKAVAANPTGGKWPDGALCGVNELDRPIQLELARQCALADVDDFPGAVFVDDARGITPLSTTIKNASVHVVKVLTGRTAG